MVVKEVKEETKQETQQLDNYFEYVVENEDTLMGISLKFDVNLRVLTTINNLGEGNIYPNQVNI